MGERHLFSSASAPTASHSGSRTAKEKSDPPPRFVRADGPRLRQILTNLAGNAVKFTDRGGVCVTVERGEEGATRFSVIDSGPGVPEDRREAIFERFEQGDGSDARCFEGAGLGLSISRELVRLMGGELTLADRPAAAALNEAAISMPLLWARGASSSTTPSVSRRRSTVSTTRSDRPASNLGQIQNFVDECDERASRAPDRFDVACVFRTERGAPQQVGHSENAADRGADFVAHCRQKP